MFSDYTATSARAMVQAVNRRPLTTTAQVRSLFSPYGICGGRVALGLVFLRGLRFSKVNSTNVPYSSITDTVYSS